MDTVDTTDKPFFSIIVPLAKDETLWRNLIEDLKLLNLNFEVIFSLPSDFNPTTIQEITDSTAYAKICTAGQNRASQLNSGARLALGKFLWFLHADSRILDINRISFNKLREETLYYFNLKFLPDGPFLCKINSFFTKYRCKFFKLPFGDQGYIIDRKSFFQSPLFNKNLNSGEDADFVTKIKDLKFNVALMPYTISTSARKYKQNGWLKTSLKNMLITIRLIFCARH